MTFEDFIDDVENGEIQGNGLLHASLEHRTALRAAFEAGQKAGAKGMFKTALVLVALAGCEVGDQTPKIVQDEANIVLVTAFCDRQTACDSELDWGECFSENRDQICLDVDCSQHMTQAAIDSMDPCLSLLGSLSCDVDTPYQCRIAVGYSDDA